MVFNSVLNCGLAPTFSTQAVAAAQKKRRKTNLLCEQQAKDRTPFSPRGLFAKDGPWLKCVLSFACCPRYTLVFLLVSAGVPLCSFSYLPPCAWTV